jgi:hypothetical protein
VERLAGRSIGIEEQGIGLQKPPPEFPVVAVHRRSGTASYRARSVVRLTTHQPPRAQKGLAGLLALLGSLL